MGATLYDPGSEGGHGKPGLRSRAAAGGPPAWRQAAPNAAGAGAGLAPAVRLTVSESSAKGNLVAEFRFDDEVYGIKAVCPSRTTCLACSNLGKVREEVATSIRFNAECMRS
jgi:hypothetical protein